MNWANRLWCLGRRSEWAYLRFYPNPGFMVPWFGKRLVWSGHTGFFVRPTGSRYRPKPLKARV